MVSLKVSTYFLETKLNSFFILYSLTLETNGDFFSVDEDCWGRFPPHDE